MSSDVTKETYRQRIWSFMERNKIALSPRPVINRIPNYKAGKILLVPTPRLKTGLLNKITPPLNATKNDLNMCSTSEGIHRCSEKVSLNSKIRVDLVIVGSVAVSITGRRIGKGEGYSDMEYAMMAFMGAVNSDTPIITIVHDCQVLTSIPEELFKDHDVPVDIIVTPTKVIRCQPKLRRPDHIIWQLLTEEKMRQIPILRILKSMKKEEASEHKETMYKSPPV